MTIYDVYLEQVGNLEGATPDTIIYNGVDYEIECKIKHGRHYTSAIPSDVYDIYGNVVDTNLKPCIMLEVRNTFGSLIWSYSEELFQELEV